MMPVALMVPCYIDMFYPRVGIATLELLERLGVDVVYPKDQTCCGQPMANSGCDEEARATDEHCAKVFGSFACVVTPSGSCTHHIRDKFTARADSPEKQNLVRNTYDQVVKKEAMRVADKVLSHPAFYQIATATLSSALEVLPQFAIYNRLNAWTKHRDIPEVARGTFHERYRNHRPKTNEVPAP
jgi:hypothetical protein